MQSRTKSIRITFVIFIPSIIALCSYIYGYYYFETVLTDHYFDLNSNHIAFIALVCALLCYTLVIIYGFYPIIFTAEKYIKHKGYQDIAIEFKFVKKTLFIGIPILIILTTADQLLTYLQLDSYLLNNYLLLYDFSFAILASSIAVVIGALLRVLTQIIKSEFRLYLAKGYCIVASEKQEDDLYKIKYLFSSLDSYNKYLLRRMEFGIKNINKIYSDIIYADTKKKDEIIRSVCQYLAEDRLKLAIYLSTLFKVPDTEQIFIKETLMQKLRTIGAFLVAVIPIVVSIIQLIHK